MVESLANLFNVLATSEAKIVRAEIYVPRLPRGIIFEYELSTLKARQRKLRELLKQERIASLNRQRRPNPNLGVAPLVVAAVVGGGAAISVLGSWIYKNYSETKQVEARISVYEQMIQDGIHPDKAAQNVYGSGSEVGSVLNKLIILSVIAAGILLYIKLK